MLLRAFSTVEGYYEYCGEIQLVLWRVRSNVKGTISSVEGYNQCCGWKPSVLWRIFITVRDAANKVVMKNFQS